MSATTWSIPGLAADPVSATRSGCATFPNPTPSRSATSRSAGSTA